jgi:hypothetical protein
VEDVESIAVYIARDSSFYAQSVVNQILPPDFPFPILVITYKSR